jgi:hypothetical protein
MAELVLLLFALLALESPSVSIAFVLAAIGVSVWRQHKFRKELEDFRQDWSAQNDALHRELIDLRRQLASTNTHGAEKDRPAVGTVERPIRPAESRPPLEKSGSAVAESEQIPLRAGKIQEPASAIVAHAGSTETRRERDSELAQKAAIPPAVSAPANPSEPQAPGRPSPVLPVKPPIVPPPYENLRGGCSNCVEARSRGWSSAVVVRSANGRSHRRKSKTHGAGFGVPTSCESIISSFAPAAIDVCLCA